MEERIIQFLIPAIGLVSGLITERRILRVLSPQWHLGWAVQFGRYFVQFPSPGDMTFYERMAAYGLKPVVQHTTYQNMGWPTKPTFGLPQIIEAA